MKKTIGILGGVVFTMLSVTMYAQTPDSTKPQTSDSAKTQMLDTTKQATPEQTMPTNPPLTTPATTTPATTTVTTSTDPWDPKKNPTVSALIEPYEGKMLPARTAATTNDIFPVLGKYTPAPAAAVTTDAAATTTTTSTEATTTTPEAGNVTISLDEQNHGLVWIEGLPMGKIKAMLRKSPATYKIPAQKTEDGKDVAEGTLVFDKTSGTLNVVIGKPYNSEDPAAAFAPAPVVDDQAVVETKTVVKTKNGKKTKTKVKAVEPPKPYVYTGTKVDATVMN